MVLPNAEESGFSYNTILEEPIKVNITKDKNDKIVRIASANLTDITDHEDSAEQKAELASLENDPDLKNQIAFEQSLHAQWAGKEQPNDWVNW